MMLMYLHRIQRTFVFEATKHNGFEEKLATLVSGLF